MSSENDKPSRRSGSAGPVTVFPALPGVGEWIAGKYQVEGVLGSGGMGVVVAARHVQLGQRVAIKFLRSEAMLDQGAVERFLREARAAVTLGSEHAAKVFDVGTLDSGEPYIVMEHLTGTDLSEVLNQRGPLGIQEAVDFVLQASEAIAEAHTHGIVHRDLKPSNLFVTQGMGGRSLVKVLDFGISEVTKGMEGSSTLTCGGYFPPPPHDRRESRAEQALMIGVRFARIAPCSASPASGMSQQLPDSQPAR